jgi:hypothetical protein
LILVCFVDVLLDCNSEYLGNATLFFCCEFFYLLEKFIADTNSNLPIDFLFHNGSLFAFNNAVDGVRLKWAFMHCASDELTLDRDRVVLRLLACKNAHEQIDAKQDAADNAEKQSYFVHGYLLVELQ